MMDIASFIVGTAFQKILRLISDRYPSLDKITQDQLGQLEYDGVRFAKTANAGEILRMILIHLYLQYLRNKDTKKTPTFILFLGQNL